MQEDNTVVEKEIRDEQRIKSQKGGHEGRWPALDIIRWSDEGGSKAYEMGRAECIKESGLSSNHSRRAGAA